MPDTALAKVIGERIRLIRKSKGFSQEEIAQIAGLHPTYIGQLERGEKNATLESINKIARALKIKLEEIVRIANQNEVKQNQTIVELVEQLYRVSESEQKNILKIIKVLIDWKLETT